VFEWVCVCCLVVMVVGGVFDFMIRNMDVGVSLGFVFFWGVGLCRGGCGVRWFEVVGCCVGGGLGFWC
jgi:hypothetical protein